MNAYVIKIKDSSFEVSAADSDIAVINADLYAQKNGIDSGRAKMYLVDSFTQREQMLGGFDLNGCQAKPIDLSEPEAFLVKAMGYSIDIFASDHEAARKEAERIAKQELIPSGRATLYRVDKNTQEQASLGEFDLRGVDLPLTWIELQLRIQDVRAKALVVAKDEYHFKCHRSRGALLVALDRDGVELVGTSDDWSMPTSKTRWDSDVRWVVAEHPTVAVIKVVVGYDGADTVRDMNDGDYTPWVGEYSAIVKVIGNPL